MMYAGAALVGLALASYTDLRGRVIPNWLNYSMIVSGIALHTADSFLSSDPHMLYSSLAGGVIAFIAGMVLFKLGAWAGGDVKLFTALGFLVPAPYGSVPAFYSAYPLFPFLIIVNSVLLSFPFVMAYVFYKVFTQRDLKSKAVELMKLTAKKTVFLGLAVAGFAHLLGWLGASNYLVVLPVLLTAFLPAPLKYGIPFLLSLWAALDGGASLVFYSLASMLAVSGFFDAMTFGRKHALRAKKRVSDLEEGDIPAYTYYADGGSVKHMEPSLWNAFREPKGVLVSSLNANGLELKDIAALKRHGIKHVWLKESVPLVPIVLLGAAASFLFGDLLWLGVRLLLNSS
ncbi:MAG: prepilin peptidase [Candidatus Diapherotrites archaeon]|nr:prepilin peptidase [Candidatus Diapherotrites archaeon]